MGHAAPRWSSWFPSRTESRCGLLDSSAGASSAIRSGVSRIVGPEIESAATASPPARRRAQRWPPGRARARRPRSRSRARGSRERGPPRSGAARERRGPDRSRSTWYGTRRPTQFVPPTKWRVSSCARCATPSGVGTPRLIVSPESSASARAPARELDEALRLGRGERNAAAPARAAGGGHPRAARGPGARERRRAARWSTSAGRSGRRAR